MAALILVNRFALLKNKTLYFMAHNKCRPVGVAYKENKKRLNLLNTVKFALRLLHYNYMVISM